MSTAPLITSIAELEEIDSYDTFQLVVDRPQRVIRSCGRVAIEVELPIAPISPEAERQAESWVEEPKPWWKRIWTKKQQLPSGRTVVRIWVDGAGITVDELVERCRSVVAGQWPVSRISGSLFIRLCDIPVPETLGD